LKILEELAKKAVSILSKAELLDEKLRDIRQIVNDHERRLCKLEGTYEGTMAKLDSAFQQTKIALMELRDRQP
jgi:hypothetical protein